MLNKEDYQNMVKNDIDYKVGADTIDITKVEDIVEPYWDVRIGFDVGAHPHFKLKYILFYYLQELLKVLHDNVTTGFGDDITRDVLKASETYCISQKPSTYYKTPTIKESKDALFTIPFHLTIYLYHLTGCNADYQNYCDLNTKPKFLMELVGEDDLKTTALFSCKDIGIYFVDSDDKFRILLGSLRDTSRNVRFGFINSHFQCVWADPSVRNIALIGSDVSLYDISIMTEDNSDEYLKKHCSSDRKFNCADIPLSLWEKHRSDITVQEEFLDRFLFSDLYRQLGGISDYSGGKEDLYYFLENMYVRCAPHLESFNQEHKCFIVDGNSSLLHINPLLKLCNTFYNCHVMDIKCDNRNSYCTNIFSEGEGKDRMTVYRIPIPEQYLPSDSAFDVSYAIHSVLTMMQDIHESDLQSAIHKMKTILAEYDAARIDIDEAPVVSFS